jgi:hypothetical protein
MAQAAVISALLYVILLPLAARGPDHPLPFLVVFLAISGLYLKAARLVWRTGGGSLPLIVGAGLLFRLILLPASPTLSGDPYRYVWDARVAAHGFNPYAAAPDEPALRPLHDAVLYPRMGYHGVPTLYPPGAQALFSLAYRIAPDSVTAVKLLLLGCDLAAAALVIALLQRFGRPVTLVLLYLWNPLVIVEFAHSGHVDAAAIACTLAALLAFERGRHGTAGVLLGMAALIKIYPLLLAPALLDRRDPRAPVLCGLTVAVGYALAWMAYGGDLFGYLRQYLEQDSVNAGLYAVFTWLGSLVGHGATMAHGLSLLILVAAMAWVTRQRLQGRGDAAASLLLITSAYLLVAPSVLPWYLTTTVPLAALTAGRGVLVARLAGLPAIWTVCSCVVALEYTHHAYRDGYWPAVLVEYAALYGLLALMLVRGVRQE